MSTDPEQILRAIVREQMKGADALTVAIITAVAGLMAGIAYADRTITDAEAAHLTAELGRIEGLGQTGAEAVAAALKQHALRLSTAYVQRFTRVLRDELPLESRLEVLDALLKVAAADLEITFDEVTSLRNITTALGLSQSHYNDLQARYRQHLKLL